jgi:hypothetical protein
VVENQTLKTVAICFAEVFALYLIVVPQEKNSTLTIIYVIAGTLEAEHLITT